MLSVNNSRQWVGAAANAQQQQPRNVILQTPATAAVFDSNIPVWQGPIDAVPSQNDAWLTNFPPPLVDQLRQVTGLNGRDPQPKDFINPQGDFGCPFCKKALAQLRFFQPTLERVLPHCSIARTNQYVEYVKASTARYLTLSSPSLHALRALGHQ